MARFSEVLSIINGRNQAAVENPNGKYPIYGSGGIMGYADDYLCEANTVVIGRKGTINKPIYVETPLWNVDTAFGLRANEDVLLPKYLYYFCEKFDFERLNTTVTIPSLTRMRLLDVEIPLPPMEQQRHIAAVLDKVCALISIGKQQLAKLDELVKARFVEMFGDPVSNPQKWETMSFASLGTLARGVSKTRPRDLPELLGGKYPLVQTGEVANAGTYIEHYKNTYSDLGLAQSKLWPKGTLCITIAANIAHTGILAFDACFPDSIVGFISGDKTNQLFVHYWFVFFQKILDAQATQVAQKNINLKILSALQVIVPPLSLQEKFSGFAKQTDKAKLTIHRSLDRLETLKNSLMQEYFGGPA